MFEGKVIALTGAASGMGLETARLLASKGAILSIADVNASALKAALESLPPPPSGAQKTHMSTVVDVCSSSQVNEWIGATVAALGPLDCAANIAGVLGGSGLIRDSTDKDWDFVMGVNAKGVFNCLRAQLNHIKEGGSIVNFASIASVATLQTQGAYVASKHAVLGLTKTAAREEGPRHIRVNCVAPGMTRTPIMNGVDEEELRRRTKRFQCIDRIADPIEVARVVAFLLSNEASFITGAYYEVSGGWTT